MSGSKIASSRSSRPYRVWAGGGILALAARRLVELGASLRVEARQDCLDEGILQQASDDLPRAELGLVESARDRGHGRDLATRLILQDLHGGADRTFVEPTAKALCLLLFPVDGADADIAEERLDVARDGAVSHTKPFMRAMSASSIRAVRSMSPPPVRGRSAMVTTVSPVPMNRPLSRIIAGPCCR